MIYDSLDQFSRYEALAPQTWKKIAAFLAGCSPQTPVGRYELDGDRLYASVQNYETHAPNPDKLEIHRKYIDIQLLLAGEEAIVVRSVEDLAVAQEYNGEKDVAFHRLPAGTPAVSLPLVPGRFAVFFPEEGHMPGLTGPGGVAPVVKVVVKIAAEGLV